MPVYSHENWDRKRFRNVARWMKDDATPIIKNTVIVYNNGKNVKEAYSYFKDALNSGLGINNSSLRNVIDYALMDFGEEYVASGLFNALFKPRQSSKKTVVKIKKDGSAK